MNILEILTPKRLLGNFGEREAARLLKRKGYKIIKRNFTADGSEIDIIAECAEAVVFVEVKSRSTDKINPKESRPAAAITPEKQRKIINAAKIYCAFNPKDKKKRFDVIEVLVEGEGKARRVKDIKHIMGAFDKSSAYAGYVKR